MTTSVKLKADLSGRQALAALAFLAVVVGSTALVALLIDDLFERAAVVAALRDRLTQIEKRVGPGLAAGGDPPMVGSPFLEGRTITVGGAALQQRIEAAVAKAGGAVLSSQIELNGPQSKDGFINLTVNVEIAQARLQQLLYDIEAGLPYLFIDTLGVSTPQGVADPEGERMIVVMGITGQWRPAQ